MGYPNEWEEPQRSMNWIGMSFLAIGWFGGWFDTVDSSYHYKNPAWNSEISGSGILHAQAKEPAKTESEGTGAAKARPLVSNQSWGAMIVFAIGVILFLVAYVLWGRTPRPKKRKKKKLF